MAAATVSHEGVEGMFVILMLVPVILLVGGVITLAFARVPESAKREEPTEDGQDS